MASTGANEIVTVVSTSRVVKCWMWGHPDGYGNARNIAGGSTASSALSNDVTDNYIMVASGYDRTWSCNMMSLVICNVGTTAGTATTGDVVIIPTTQKTLAASDIPLPTPGTTDTQYTIFPAVPAKLVDAFFANGGSAGDSSMGMIAGTDEYLGTMTYVSGGDTDLTTLM